MFYSLAKGDRVMSEVQEVQTSAQENGDGKAPAESQAVQTRRASSKGMSTKDREIITELIDKKSERLTAYIDEMSGLVSQAAEHVVFSKQGEFDKLEIKAQELSIKMQGLQTKQREKELAVIRVLKDKYEARIERLKSALTK